MNKLLSLNSLSVLKTCLSSSMLRITQLSSYSTKVMEPLRKCVLMSNDKKHVICYHPEEDHPFEFTKPIERKIQTDESALNSDIGNLYRKRFDTKVPTNHKELWFDSLRLAKTFNENPMKFRILRRSERIRAHFKSKIEKKRDSI